MVDWMDTCSIPTCSCMPSQSLDVRTARFPGGMAAEIAAVPGVERVQTVRNGRTTFRGKPAMVVAIEMAQHSPRR